MTTKEGRGLSAEGVERRKRADGTLGGCTKGRIRNVPMGYMACSS